VRRGLLALAFVFAVVSGGPARAAEPGPGSILPTMAPQPSPRPSEPLVSALLPVSGLGGAAAIFVVLLVAQRRRN
jgi:hypothetical protein